MYFRSVRFYKHLILLFVAFILMVPIMFLIISIMRNAGLNKQIAILKTQEKSYSDCIKNMNQTLLNNKLTPKINVNYAASNSSNSINEKNNKLIYQSLYPKLICNNGIADFTNVKEKAAYLTFDDGPSDETNRILDILKKNGIKATFFVIYRNDDYSKKIYKRIVAEGHSIGIHSYSHDYTQIYKSPEDFLSDFNNIYNFIFELTGVKCQIFRFPGGSINSYNTTNYQEIIAEMTRRGFIYYDWNVSSGDAGEGFTKKSITNSVISGVDKYDKSIILMHDSSSKYLTVAAIPDIITALKRSGYLFKGIDASVEPINFAYKP